MDVKRSAHSGTDYADYNFNDLERELSDGGRTLAGPLTRIEINGRRYIIVSRSRYTNLKLRRKLHNKAHSRLFEFTTL